MKCKIYYQDFSLNSMNLNDDDIKIDHQNAVFIYELEIDNQNKKEICELIWFAMNNLNVPKGHKDGGKFEKAGHTSMSIGDYIVFEDGTAYVALKVGWKEIESECSKYRQSQKVTE